VIRAIRRSGPGSEESCFRYTFHRPDGNDLGEAKYALRIRAGEKIHITVGKRFLRDDSHRKPSGFV